jgi:multidrug efflux system membrane fusion protein
VNAWLRLDVRRGAVVPESVVQAGPDGDFAYIVRPDSSVAVRSLRVGVAQDGRALIDTGLTAGDRVVADGQSKLRPGVRIIDINAPRAAEGARSPSASLAASEP